MLAQRNIKDEFCLTFFVLISFRSTFRLNFILLKLIYKNYRKVDTKLNLNIYI